WAKCVGRPIEGEQAPRVTRDDRPGGIDDGKLRQSIIEGKVREDRGGLPGRTPICGESELYVACVVHATGHARAAQTVKAAHIDIRAGALRGPHAGVSVIDAESASGRP